MFLVFLCLYLAKIILVYPKYKITLMGYQITMFLIVILLKQYRAFVIAYCKIIALLCFIFGICYLLIFFIALSLVISHNNMCYLLDSDNFPIMLFAIYFKNKNEQHLLLSISIFVRSINGKQ